MRPFKVGGVLLEPSNLEHDPRVMAFIIDPPNAVACYLDMDECAHLRDALDRITTRAKELKRAKEVSERLGAPATTSDDDIPF